MTLTRLSQLGIRLTNDTLTPGACNSTETKDQIRVKAMETKLKVNSLENSMF